MRFVGQLLSAISLSYFFGSAPDPSCPCRRVSRQNAILDSRVRGNDELRSLLCSSTLLFALLALVIGCVRGTPHEQPPIHVNPNMDNQEKYSPQSESQFFEDGASMRQPVAGTVARGEYHADNAYYRGRDEIDSLIALSPVPTSYELLKRGQERFNIFCSPCHGQTGGGKGIIVQRGYLPPPTFHDPRILALPDGHFFDVITNGIRNMPAYRSQVPVDDRWAIVAYLRALQRSQKATIEDIPAEERQNLK